MVKYIWLNDNGLVQWIHLNLPYLWVSLCSLSLYSTWIFLVTLLTFESVTTFDMLLYMKFQWLWVSKMLAKYSGFVRVLFQVFALNVIFWASECCNSLEHLVSPAVSLTSTFSTLDNLYSLQASTLIDAKMSTWMWCTCRRDLMVSIRL